MMLNRILLSGFHYNYMLVMRIYKTHTLTIALRTAQRQLGRNRIRLVAIEN